MILFGFQFTGLEFVPDLYYKKSNRVDSLPFLKKSETIDFGAYFHYFPIGLWKEFTDLKSLSFSIQFSGYLKIRLIGRRDGEDKILREIESDSGSIEIDFDLDTLASNEYIFPEILALEDSHLLSAEFKTSDPPSNSIRLALIITTYNREDYIRKNLEKIGTYYESHKEEIPFEIFLVDNASNLNVPDSSFLNYIKNKNLGGSGGFTRGIISALDKKSFTHFCLMDDDVEVDPSFLERLFSFLSFLKKEYSEETISGSILRKDLPKIQYEWTGEWNGILQKINYRNLDLSGFQNLDSIKNRNTKKNTFSAWCLVCYPESYFQKNGLPLPLFIRGDDLEFSLRNKIQPILLKGFSVWHETFDPSKQRDWLAYYNTRNYLIINFLYADFGRLKFFPLIGIRLFYYLLKKRKSIPFMKKAILDILSPDSFWGEETSDLLHKNLMKIQSEESIFLSCFKIIYSGMKVFRNYSGIQSTLKKKKSYLTGMEYWKEKVFRDELGN
ncbi:MAG: glycosyltransferase [Leptospiraceae bacterium]|nr:glycosyltransferase [Leptospiraceae bacterium]